MRATSTVIASSVVLLLTGCGSSKSHASLANGIPGWSELIPGRSFDASAWPEASCEPVPGAQGLTCMVCRESASPFGCALVTTNEDAIDTVSFYGAHVRGGMAGWTREREVMVAAFGESADNQDRRQDGSGSVRRVWQAEGFYAELQERYEAGELEGFALNLVVGTPSDYGL